MKLPLNKINIHLKCTHLFTGFLFFFVNLSAQEVLVKIIPQADILILDEKKGAKTYLADDYAGFTEARLYQLIDSSYALEVFHESGEQLIKDRQILSQSEVDGFRERLYRQYFFGYKEKEFDQSGRSLLVTGSTVVGLGYYGYALPLSLSVDGDKTFLALYMLTSGAGFFVPFSATKNLEVSRAQASMTLWGQTRGIYQGIALSFGLSNEPETEALLGIGMGTSILEGFLNFKFARDWDFTPGDASVYQMGGDAGAIGGLLLADMFNLYEKETSQGVFITSLAGSIAGMAGGKYLADTRQYTVGDAIYFRSSIIMGTHAAISFVNLFQPEKSKPYTLGALVGGAVGGYWAERNLKGRDYTTGQGILIAVGQLGGGLLGLGLGYLVASDPSDSEILLISSAIGAGAGFALLSHQFSSNTNIETSNINFNLNLNPLGFYQPKSLASLPPVPGISLSVGF